VLVGAYDRGVGAVIEGAAAERSSCRERIEE
jgi:hypothetical protein